MKRSQPLGTLALVGTGLVFVTLSPVLAQYDQVILDDSPVVYWRLDDDELALEALDLGLGVGTVTTIENVELGADGIVPNDNNQAARFNGQDALIRVDDNEHLNSGGPWEERTTELWFSADDVTLDTPQVLFEEGGTTRGVAIYIQGGELVMGAWNRANDDSGVSSPWANPMPEAGPDEQSVYFSRPIKSNVAYHAALVMDGDPQGFTGTLTGYLDGSPFGLGTGVGQLFGHGDNVGIGAMHQNILLRDGSNPGGDGLYFAGVIDEVAIFDAALDSDTILAHALIEKREPPGDFNADGVVDTADFQIMLDNFGESSLGRNESVNLGDFNRDQTVDMEDFRDFRAAFHAPAGAATAAAVPEPGMATMLIGLLGGAMLLPRRRYR